MQTGMFGKKIFFLKNGSLSETSEKNPIQIQIQFSR